MEQKQSHSILLDLVLLTVMTSLFSLLMPFVCLAPILAAALAFTEGWINLKAEGGQFILTTKDGDVMTFSRQ